MNLYRRLKLRGRTRPCWFEQRFERNGILSGYEVTNSGKRLRFRIVRITNTNANERKPKRKP